MLPKDKLVELSFQYVIIVKRDRTDRPENYTEVLKWQGYTVDQLVKWKWYFQYREALLRIKYPRHHFEVYTCRYHVKDNAKEYKTRLGNVIVARKRKITEMSRKLDLAIKTWNKLFPIENEELYQKAVAKIERLKRELAEYEAEFETLANSQINPIS